MENYDRSIELNSKNPAVYYNRASTYKIVKDPAKALRDLSFAIELNPKAPNYYF